MRHSNCCGKKGFRVIDAVKAIIEVENYQYAMSQLAQTTLRSVCGQAELDGLLSASEKINSEQLTCLFKNDPGRSVGYRKYE